MKKDKKAPIITIAVVTALLSGCGGGGGNPGKCSGSKVYCDEVAASKINNNQSSSTPSFITTTLETTTLCNEVVGNKLLVGAVIDVQDGDTLTIGSSGVSYKIRLDSIDAPELAQSFGSESKLALEKLVIGKNIKVAYSKSDKYGRIIGAIFTDACLFVNLEQVAKGMAWFYKAYQCEIDADLRTKYAEAQNNAFNAKLGLWSENDPAAPWFYRNGVDPVTPICSTNSATLISENALSADVPTTNSSTTSIVNNNTCYTGPRGGKYTLNSTGTKNYGGC